MGNSGLTYFIQQMLYQMPTLLAALVGIVLSFIFMKRAKIPAFVTLLGCATVIIGSLMVTIAQAYFFSASFSSLAITSNSYVQMAKIVSWIGTLIRGFSILLLIVAIFIGRKGPQPVPQTSSPAL